MVSNPMLKRIGNALVESATVTSLKRDESNSRIGAEKKIRSGCAYGKIKSSRARTKFVEISNAALPLRRAVSRGFTGGNRKRTNVSIEPSRKRSSAVSALIFGV